MTITNIALSGLQAAQAALTTASQNVANVMTPGYTRQGVLLASMQTLGSSKSPGAGVDVTSLLRFSDGYKSQQLWQSNSSLGQYTAPQPYMTQIEQVMGDSTSNIDGGIDAFFAALNAATAEPTSIPLRQQVITTADAMAQRFNSLYQLIQNQQASVQSQATAMVNQASALTTSIAALNEKIAAAQGTGASVSGIIDERDSKIDELANIVSIQVVDQPDGSRSVSLAGSGQPLVIGSMAASLQLTSSDPLSVELKFANQTYASLPIAGKGGSLGGLGDYLEKELKPLKGSIEQLAKQFTDAVNGVLTSSTGAFDLNGNPGVNLFDVGTTGMPMKVSSTITAQTLAFSTNATTIGDSTNLQALVALKDQSLSFSSSPPTSYSLVTGSISLGDVHAQVLGQLAMQSQQNQIALSTATTVRNQAEESWKSTSGVNSDEEAINLTQYSQMYQANMKVIAVANQLFDSTLAMLD